MVGGVLRGVEGVCFVRHLPGRWFDGGNADDVGGRFGCHVERVSYILP